MAYEKQEWIDHYEGIQDGTPVDAKHLNYMEEGIRKANRQEVVLYYDDSGYLCVENVDDYDEDEAEETE